MVNAIVTAVQQPKRLLVAGLAGTIVLAIFMEGIARLMMGAPMKPAGLICNALQLGPGSMWLCEAAHYANGIVIFPLGFAIFFGLVALGSAIVAGLVWGIVLWLGAAVVIAPAGGLGFLFGGGQMLVTALIAHLAYGAVLGAVYGKQARNLAT